MVAPQATQIHQRWLEVEFPEFQEAISMNNQRLIQKVEQRLHMLVDGLGVKATRAGESGFDWKKVSDVLHSC